MNLYGTTPRTSPHAAEKGAGGALLRFERATRLHPEEDILALLEPEVRAWWTATFGTFTMPQRYAVKELHEGRNVLVSSPTGSGKTLSAFLAALNELFRLAKAGELADEVHVLYVSPLKALNNDIRRNLLEPLDGIRRVVEAGGGTMPDIRIGVRTGDTEPKERQRMTRTPPHILITTPESLAILLNAPRFRPHLAGVRWIVIDEVHALADNKRGAHLALALERLAAGCRRDPTRVGLSATIAPLEEVARFLVGAGPDGERDCLLVDANLLKATDLRVIAPPSDLVLADADEARNALYKTLDELIDGHRTTLVFTNTRAGTERVVFHLKERFGDKYAEAVEAHHGSLSRETRISVEERLKRGELKCVVCSTSLELGIDIGFVDLVVLLGSPKSTARCLQRVGRAGHRLSRVSKGRIVVLDRDDLVESVVIAKKALDGDIDRVSVVRNPLDVLVQHLVGMSLDGTWRVDDAFALVRRAYPFRDLPEADFRAVLAYLAGRSEALRERRVYPKVWLDEETQEFGSAGRLARPIYFTNVGVIPDQSEVNVFTEGRFLGKMSEEFAERLADGDVFVLGGRTYEWRYTRGQKATVEAAPSKTPTVPSWVSEQLPLSLDLARAVQTFRREVAARLDDEGRDAVVAWLAKEYPVDADLAGVLADLVEQQLDFARVPTDEEVVVEEWTGMERRTVYAFHTMLGRRANEALARCFGRRAGAMKRTKALVTVADHGFTVTLPRDLRITEYEMRSLFLLDVAKELPLALEGSELLRRRFRHVAARAFLILRNYKGRTMSVGKQQVASHVLYHTLVKLEDEHPILKEAFREVEEDALDLRGAQAFLEDVLARKIRIHYLRNRATPSPFAFQLVTAGTADEALAEARRARIRGFHAEVLKAIREGGAVRPPTAPPRPRSWADARAKRRV